MLGLCFKTEMLKTLVYVLFLALNFMVAFIYLFSDGVHDEIFHSSFHDMLPPRSRR